MKGFLLLPALVILITACGKNTTEFEGGIPSGLRALLNGMYWEADSTIAYKMSARSSTDPSVRTMLVVKGFRWNSSNTLDVVSLTLHNDRAQKYTTSDENCFIEISITNAQGISTRFIAFPDKGEGQAEIFSLKDDTINGHFSCAAVATESVDSLYVDAGSFKLPLEDHTNP
jgi:hypothetical protein